MKKSQLTQFFIVGIILVVLTVILLWSINNQTTGSLDLEKLNSEIAKRNIEIVQSYGNGCLHEAANKGLYERIAPQGGYIDPGYNAEYGDYDTVDYEILGPYKVAYWYKNGIKNVPTLDMIAKKFERYIVVEFERCINKKVLRDAEILMPEYDYDSFAFDFSLTEVDPDVRFNDRDITIELEYPIAVITDWSTEVVKNFHAEIPVTYKTDYELGAALLDSAVSAYPDLYHLDLNCNQYSGNGATNVYYRNYKYVEIFDYLPLYIKHDMTLTFRYLAENLKIIGFCPP